MDHSAVLLAEHAPAKINLALHVTGRRPDGYHLIESLAVFTRYGDRVTVAAASEDSFSASGPFGAEIPLDGGNLVMRARDALRRVHSARRWHSFAPSSVLPDISPTRGEIEPAACLPPIANITGMAVAPKLPISPLVGEMSGRTEGGNVGRALADIANDCPVTIHLEKNLPVASGIGGGSSDAAAVLNILTQLWKIGITLEQLTEIGQQLGADIPMCLAARPLIARGIGETIEPLPTFPSLPIVLVNPSVPVSTPDVFRALALRENPPLPPLPRNPDFEALLDWLTSTRNDLQAPAISIAPAIAQAIEALTSAGAAFARMSGSGATCFGLFETPDEAARAKAEIRARQPGWWAVATESIPSKDAAHAPA